MDYNLLEKASAAPEAASMIETFRAIGYNLETAVADIIDNSISAGAKNIRITTIWKGGQSLIAIKDDGCGMNSNEIIQAMRPGAQNPLSERNSNDLGRYGLGLKTASFSQCRKLSVLSKKLGYCAAYWTWDLDYVAQSDSWELLHWMPEEYKSAFTDLIKLSSHCAENMCKASRAFFRDLTTVRDYSQKVYFCEHESDVCSHKILEEIFDSSRPLAEKLHLKQFIEGISNIADQAEDTIDQLLIFAIKRDI